MTVELLADYRGVLTSEVYYAAGVYAVGEAMPLSHANALVQAGRAIALDADEAKPTRKGKRS